MVGTLQGHIKTHQSYQFQVPMCFQSIVIRQSKLIISGVFVLSLRGICFVNLKVLSAAIHKLLAFDQSICQFN